MSVICFDPAEILIAKKMLKYVVDGPRAGDLERHLRYTSAWREEAMFTEGDDRKTLSKVMDRMFWYVQVANRIAYALQYHEEPGLFEGEDIDEEWSKMTPFRCSIHEARAALSHLAYNLATNDGRVFLPREWEEAWDRTRSFLSDIQARRADETLDGAHRALWEIANQVGLNPIVQAKEA